MLQNDLGELKHHPKDINDIFSKLFKKLYSSPNSCDENKSLSWLEKVQLKTLSQDELADLNAPITTSEITSVIKTLSNSKAPGPDGLSSEFYKILQKDISPTLVNVYDEILKNSRFLPSANETYIKLIFKKNKDPTKPESYRPISLINQDLKILTKLMANRLAPYMPKLIHPNQVGFTQGRSAVSNIRKLLTILEQVKAYPSTHQKSAVLLLDAHKAFDEVSWKWLDLVLTKMGFTAAAKKAILNRWIYPTIPTIQDIKDILLDLFLMDKVDSLLHKEKKAKKFFKKWKHFITLIFTAEEIQSLVSPFRYTGCSTMATLPLFLLLLCLIPANAYKPNILLLMADDLGIGDVGCYGNNTIRSPNIDRLAKEGVKLTQHIAAASLCSPSRSAFLTGRYPIRTGMTGHSGYSVLMWNAASGGLPKDETTFAKVLKQQGYSTGVIGKWHLGVNCESRNDFCHHPLNHGFDYFFGLPFTLINECEPSRPKEVFIDFMEALWFRAQIFIIAVLTLVVIRLQQLIVLPWKIIFILASFGTLYFLYWYVALTFQPYWNCILMRNFEIVEQPMDMDKKARQVVDEAKAFIRRNKNGPFLLFVSFLHVHTPLYTTKRFRGQSKHDLYGDNIEELDWMVGEILDTIDKENLVNNTLTYFTSDHGAYLEGMEGSRHLRGSNGIYRGGKGMGGLEGGIRVPGIIRWPGVVPANTSVDSSTSLMDIFPTVIKLGGGTLPQDRIIDGKDLMPLLHGIVLKSEHDFLFHYCNEHLHAVRWQETSRNTTWKAHYISPRYYPEEAGHCRGTKLCSCSGGKAIYHVPPLLFNLSNDPRENNPLPSDSVLYREVILIIQQAVAHHQSTLHPAPQQLYGLNNVWNPILQPCCGMFPLCWCNKEVNTTSG
ncbi:arylsulfatase H-like [Hyperolius riggenbachi]|uniref:arylsulfatase H-like n=1 Tax=Hyperolius riggenbachi TaxID=752182 RepID=UPI0035A2E236